MIWPHLVIKRVANLGFTNSQCVVDVPVIDGGEVTRQPIQPWDMLIETDQEDPSHQSGIARAIQLDRKERARRPFQTRDSVGALQLLLDRRADAPLLAGAMSA